eukprot:3416451-Amphidinium_carterae.1
MVYCNPLSRALAPPCCLTSSSEKVAVHLAPLGAVLAEPAKESSRRAQSSLSTAGRSKRSELKPGLWLVIGVISALGACSSDGISRGDRSIASTESTVACASCGIGGDRGAEGYSSRPSGSQAGGGAESCGRESRVACALDGTRRECWSTTHDQRCGLWSGYPNDRQARSVHWSCRMERLEHCSTLLRGGLQSGIDRVAAQGRGDRGTHSEPGAHARSKRGFHPTILHPDHDLPRSSVDKSDECGQCRRLGGLASSGSISRASDGHKLRHASMLLDLLNFDMAGEATERLATFDRLLTKYEMAVQEKRPTKLKHILLNVEKWSTYERLKTEIENITRAQIAANSSTSPMDLGAMSQQAKGNKGKGLGRGYGGAGKGVGVGGKSSNPAAGVTCHICQKVGHYARDCWHKDKGKGTQQGKGKDKGKGKGAPQGGGKNGAGKDPAKTKCWRCGGKGHRAKDCKAPLSAVDAGAGQSNPTPPVAGLYLAALSVGHNEQKKQPLSMGIDSGAAASVVPREATKSYTPTQDSLFGRSYESATGEKIYDEGLVQFACKIGGRERLLRARKTRVKKGLLNRQELHGAQSHQGAIPVPLQEPCVGHRDRCIASLTSKAVGGVQFVLDVNQCHRASAGVECGFSTAGPSTVRPAIATPGLQPLGVERDEMCDEFAAYNDEMRDEFAVDDEREHDEMRDDLGYEHGPARMRPLPQGPSRREKEMHEASGHIPYRSWCSACVRGKGHQDSHRREKTGDGREKRATLGIDYAYFESRESATEAEGSPAPVLVGRDNATRMTLAEVVPSNGIQYAYSIQILVDWVRLIGHSEVTIKSDGEPAIMELKTRAAAVLRVKHGYSVHLEESPEGESQANGLAEGAARDVKAVVRTLACAVGAIHDITIHARHAVMAFLVRHAAFVLNVGQMGADGLTPWQRARGKRFGGIMVPIGETILYHLGKGPSRNEPRWDRGIFLGFADRNLSFVGIAGKVVKARSIRRLPREEQADVDLLSKVAGSPWQLGNEEHAEPAAIFAEPEVPAEDAPGPEDALLGRRRTYLRRDVELKTHGYTPNCHGCEAARLRQPARAHTEVCRRRIEKLMRKSEKGRERLEATRVRMDVHEESLQGGLGKRPAETSADLESDMQRPKVQETSASASASGAGDRSETVDVQRAREFRAKRAMMDRSETEVSRSSTKRARETSDEER